MTYSIRRSQDRQFFDHGWLKTYHTFSFGSFYDPQFMGFRALRVINEDRVAPGGGFPPHGHQNMEIISLVIEGELAHRDSTGTESVIHANDVQTMSAGTGITHSEYNPSTLHPVHFLQIWIIPDQEGHKPAYQQRQLPATRNQWQLIASKSGREQSLTIHQDVELYALTLDKQIEKNVLRYGWLQVIEGELSLNGDQLRPGDGVAIEPRTQLSLETRSPSKMLFFDLN